MEHRNYGNGSLEAVVRAGRVGAGKMQGVAKRGRRERETGKEKREGEKEKATGLRVDASGSEAET